MPASKLTAGQKRASWICQILAALILAQTLWFKLGGAEESVFIFSRLGVEPWGRVAVALVEVVAVVLLLRSRTAVLGAMVSLFLMVGAIGAHLTRIGVVVRDDHGLLFLLASTVLGCSALILYLRRHQLPAPGLRFQRRHATHSTAPSPSPDHA